MNEIKRDNDLIKVQFITRRWIHWSEQQYILQHIQGVSRPRIQDDPIQQSAGHWCEPEDLNVGGCGDWLHGHDGETWQGTDEGAQSCYWENWHDQVQRSTGGFGNRYRNEESTWKQHQSTWNSADRSGE